MAVFKRIVLVAFFLPAVVIQFLNAQPSPPVITSFTVEGKRVPPASIIRLDKEGSSFAFEYASPGTDTAKSVRYAYRLKNFDRQWRDAGTRTYINYTNIPGGTYYFSVRVTVDGLNWAEMKKPVEIHISRPFFSTGWFTVLIALTILIATGLVINYSYRVQLKRILMTQKIRNDIAGDLHDDIGSTLSSIMLMSELAKKQPGKAMNYLTQISENARRVIENMNDIVWAVNPVNDSMEDMLVRMQSFAAELLERKNIDLHFETTPKVEGLKLDMRERKNLYLIFKEAIHNAMKYAQCTKVSVKLHAADHEAVLSIEDNGIGFDTGRDYTGNGLRNLQRRAVEIGGRLEINSASGLGTSVRLTLRPTRTGS